MFKLPYLTGGDASLHAEEIAFLFHIRAINGSGMVSRWRKTPTSALGEEVNYWHIATPPTRLIGVHIVHGRKMSLEMKDLAQS